MKGHHLAGCLLLVALVAAAAEPPPPFQLNRVPPQYPKDAARQKVQGFVDFEVTIGEDGTALGVTILESSPAGTFDAAARESIMQWRFLPKCTARFERPFKQRSRVEFKLATEPKQGDSDLYAVEQQLAVAPPDRKIVKSADGFVIEAVDPCAKPHAP